MVPLRIALAFLCADAAAVAQEGGDWPQWRGPHRDGVSRETGWSSRGRPESLWTCEVGLGYSGLVIQDGRLFTLGHDPERELDTVFALDAESGDELWTHTLPSQTWSQFHGGGTLTTPAVDGGRLYVTQREGNALCFEAATGELVWARNYARELGLALCTHGSAGSPLAFPEALVFSVCGTTLAVRREDGAVIWRTEDYGDRSYASPAELERGGRSLLAVFNGAGLVVLDRASGAELHRYPWAAGSTPANTATPVIDGDRVFISSAYNTGCALLQLGDEGLEPLWENRRMRSKTNGCVLWDGHLYGFDESMLKCLGLDGEERWRRRGLGLGSLSVAGGRLILLSSRGELIVAEATPAEYRELSRAKVLDGGVYWTSPVLAGGRIYCRNSLGSVVCRDHRSEPDGPAAADSLQEDLPAPEALFARHLQAVGGEAALRRAANAHMEGWIEVLGAGVRRTPMTLRTHPPNRSLLHAELELYGRIQVGFDGELGWSLDSTAEDRLLAGGELRELRETTAARDLLFPEAVYASLQTEAVVEFAGRPCHAVAATTAGGGERRLYFDAGDGLLRGRDGPDESLVIYSEYRLFDGVRLPARWSVQGPVDGIERTLAIDAVELGAAGPAAFEPPPEVAWMAKDPAQRRAEGAALQRRYGALLGVYSPDPSAPVPGRFEVSADLGGLVISSAGRPSLVLLPPRAGGRWALSGSSGAFATFERDPGGAVRALRVHGPGEALVLHPLAGPAEPRDARVDALLARHLQDGQAAAVMVLRDGALVHRQSYGLPEFGAGLPDRPDVQFLLESAHRQFTAAVVLQLVERGELDLEDTLADHFPDLPPFAAEVTLRHLLTRNARLPEPPGEAETAAGVLATLRGLEQLPATPGSGRAADLLLASIAERATDRPLAELWSTLLFEPLGMERTALHPTPGPGPAEPGTLPLPCPGPGGLRSTLADLLLWDRALVEGRLVGDAVLEDAFAPPDRGPGAGQVFGWRVEARGGARVLRYTGRLGDRRITISRVLDPDLSVVLVTAGSGLDGDLLAGELAAAFL